MIKSYSIVVLVLGPALLCSPLGCKQKKSTFTFPHIPAIVSENLTTVVAFDEDNILLAGDYNYLSTTGQGSQICHENSKQGFWTVQHTGLNGELICDVVFPDRQNGWAVGILGAIIHTTDGGKTWERQNSGTGKHLFSVSFPDKNNGWVAGDVMTLIHTSDGGKTWEPQTVQQSTDENVFASEVIFNGVYFLDAQEGWLVGEFGSVYHTTDGGRNWQIRTIEALQPKVDEDEWELPKLTLFDVRFFDRQRGFILGVDGTMLKTDDGGREWKKVDSAAVNSLFSIAAIGDTCWAVGDRGVYIVSTDGGNTWTNNEHAIHTKGWLTSVAFVNDNVGWVVGKSGAVFKTIDGGKTFEWLSGVSYDWPEFKPPKELVGE
jgi:photosystem II stability/assembly factor-like uncharacterized protein